MPRPRRHYLDDLADELFAWLQTETEALTEAFKAGGRSPFAAPVSEKDKLEFYRRALFNKDGSPNEQGRQQTLARVGVEGYVRIMKAVMQGGEEQGEAPEVPGGDETEAA